MRHIWRASVDGVSDMAGRVPVPRRGTGLSRGSGQQGGARPRCRAGVAVAVEQPQSCREAPVPLVAVDGRLVERADDLQPAAVGEPHGAAPLNRSARRSSSPSAGSPVTTNAPFGAASATRSSAGSSSSTGALTSSRVLVLAGVARTGRHGHRCGAAAQQAGRLGLGGQQRGPGVAVVVVPVAAGRERPSP